MNHDWVVTSWVEWNLESHAELVHYVERIEHGIGTVRCFKRWVENGRVGLHGRGHDGLEGGRPSVFQDGFKRVEIKAAKTVVGDDNAIGKGYQLIGAIRTTARMLFPALTMASSAIIGVTQKETRSFS